MTLTRPITVHYARSIYRATATFDVDGAPMRVDDVWLLAGRFNLGEAGLGALRAAIEVVNGLLAAEPGTCFSFEDYARCDAAAASASGALARAVLEEGERLSPLKSVPSRAPSQLPGQMAGITPKEKHDGHE